MAEIANPTAPKPPIEQIPPPPIKEQVLERPEEADLADQLNGAFRDIRESRNNGLKTQAAIDRYNDLHHRALDAMDGNESVRKEFFSQLPLNVRKMLSRDLQQRIELASNLAKGTPIQTSEVNKVAEKAPADIPEAAKNLTAKKEAKPKSEIAKFKDGEQIGFEYNGKKDFAVFGHFNKDGKRYLLLTAPDGSETHVLEKELRQYKKNLEIGKIGAAAMEALYPAQVESASPDRGEAEKKEGTIPLSEAARIAANEVFYGTARDPLKEPVPAEMEVKPFSGILEFGDEINFLDKKWKLLHYRNDTGVAIISDVDYVGSKNGRITEITQEQLYAANQELAKKKLAQKVTESTAQNASRVRQEQGEPALPNRGESEPPKQPEQTETTAPKMETKTEAPKAPELREEDPEKRLRLIEARLEQINNLLFSSQIGKRVEGQPSDAELKQEYSRLLVDRRDAIIDILKRDKRELEEEQIKLNEELGSAGGDKTKIKEIENRLKQLRKEHSELEKQIKKFEEYPEPGFANHARAFFEKAEKKGGKIFGWLKGRLKGIATLGFWEYKEALKFRGGTKNVGENIADMANVIKTQHDLSAEDAMAEAIEIKKRMEAAGMEATREIYEKLSNDITAEKVKENNAHIDKIIQAAVAQLMIKIRKYRGQADDKEVMLDQEKVHAMVSELYGELNKLRDGGVRRDLVNYTEVIRKNLDKRYWARYVYGLLETVLAGVGIGYIAEAVLPAAGAEGVGGATATAGAEKVGEVTINKSVWHTLDVIAKQHGVHLTNQQLVNFSQEVVNNNNWVEQAWSSTFGNAGLSTRHLPVGTLIQHIPAHVLTALGVAI